MKIRKVDDKPMVIHTKEKAKIHAHEPKGAKIKGSNIYTVERGPKTAGAMAELNTHVSPHVLRHTKAMHLLEAGINIFYIKDFLGHEDISTTEVYAKASIETQRRALEKHSLVLIPATPSWMTNTDTLEWLKALGK